MVIKEIITKDKWLRHTLKNIEPDDWIIINDIDEIPNLKNVNFKEISK